MFMVSNHINIKLYFMANRNIKNYLNRLFNQEVLEKQEAKDIMSAIARGEVDSHQTTALLTAFQMRRITGPELSGFREAMIDLAVKIDFSDLETIDIVGTGGDGKNTFNISTVTAFVVAGAGYKVAKHGNKGVSSPCGSSNVLEYLGYTFSKDYDKLRQDIETANFCFFHAPFFHPAMKEVMPIRKALQVKTVFNIMGPLLNPSKPKHQFSGVYAAHILPLYKDVFEDMGINFGVVFAHDGYDEISLTADFTIVNNNGSKTYNASDLSLQTVLVEDLHGGNTVQEAAEIFTSILEGKGSPSQNHVVLTNAAFSIQTFKPDQSFTSCFDEAKHSLESGQARETLRLVTR